MQTLLPWHDSIWQQVLHTWQQDRLPHALLLCGVAGMGKSAFAQRLAETLLCEKSPLPPFTHSVFGNATGIESWSRQTCGQCKACHLLRVGNHPDLLWVQPAEVGKSIQVDQIRELIQFASLTAKYGRYQIVVINPADAMNHQAANSLLKLLEEPPPKTHLLLISQQPLLLSATIRSRCQRLDFNKVNHALVKDWLHTQLPSRTDIPLLLNLTDQAPLAALTLVESEGMTKRQHLFDSLAILLKGRDDPIKLAEQWYKLTEVAQLLQWMFSWTLDLMRYSLTGQTSYILNQDQRTSFQSLSRLLDVQALFNLLELQRDAYRLVNNTNVKTQGILETIAIAWLELNSTR